MQQQSLSFCCCPKLHSMCKYILNMSAIALKLPYQFIKAFQLGTAYDFDLWAEIILKIQNGILKF